MFLILILKILFPVLIAWYLTLCVSYHIRHHNKKARVFHGNCRMPYDVEFALMYGIKPKTRFKVIDWSYRKSLPEWKRFLNTIYPPDDLNIIPQPNSINPTLQSHPNSNSNLTTLPSHANPNQNYFTLPPHPNSNSNLTTLPSHPHPNPNPIGVTNWKRKPFPALKTGNHNPIYFTQPSHPHSNSNLTTLPPHPHSNSNLTGYNLKISQTTIPFPK
jgi:hypothetical protein